MSEDLVGVNVTITRKQKEWAEKNHIKLSSLIRTKLEEERTNG